MHRRNLKMFVFFNPRSVCLLSLCVSLESWGSSYWRGLVGYVVFAEGGVFVLKMEEMFLRRLVVVLWEKFCSSCLNPFDSGLVVFVVFVGVSCPEGFCAV